MSEDDDIIAGSLKMSLKCPLSFMRINTPCRSAKCSHSQCFDATSWYAVMQQTTTWLCPVCENVLDWRELIIDGFFAEILKTTPDSVDDVLVESDGQWHTTDGRYSSSGTARAAPALYEVIDSDSDDDYF
ncbi:MIZ/SP-RING zinc finger-domain-containing protein [Mycena vulgaris]|nr:MIZ/SP-RING zinc finger-domain-containing protein [Mycena vulgaris]